jgi:hypothetical protein
MILSRPNSESSRDSWEYFFSPLTLLNIIGPAPVYFRLFSARERKVRVGLTGNENKIVLLQVIELLFLGG